MSEVTGLLVRFSSLSASSPESAVRSETVLLDRSSVSSFCRLMSASISATAQPDRFRLVSSGSVTMVFIAAVESVQPDRSSDCSSGSRDRTDRSSDAPWCRDKERRPVK